MKHKYAFIDLDGVVLGGIRFSDRQEEMYPDADHKAITDFFTKGTYNRAAIGEVDIVDLVEMHIKEFKVSVDAKKFVDDWYSGENNINHDVLKKIDAIRETGVACYITSDHTIRRKQEVWDELSMKDHFDGMVVSAEVGHTKHEKEFFIQAMSLYGISDPARVWFTDDDPKNVDIAKELGIDAYVFESVETFDRLDN